MIGNFTKKNTVRRPYIKILMLFLFYTQEHIYIIVHIQYSIIHISISQLKIDSTSLLTSLEFETVLLLLYIGMQLLRGEKHTKKLVKQSTISLANPNCQPHHSLEIRGSFLMKFPRKMLHYLP